MLGYFLGGLSLNLTSRRHPEMKNTQQLCRADHPLRIWGKSGHYSRKFLVQESMEGVASWALEENLNVPHWGARIRCCLSWEAKHLKISIWIQLVPENRLVRPLAVSNWLPVGNWGQTNQTISAFPQKVLNVNRSYKLPSVPSFCEFEVF